MANYVQVRRLPGHEINFTLVWRFLEVLAWTSPYCVITFIALFLLSFFNRNTACYNIDFCCDVQFVVDHVMKVTRNVIFDIGRVFSIKWYQLLAIRNVIRYSPILTSLEKFFYRHSPFLCVAKFFRISPSYQYFDRHNRVFISYDITAFTSLDKNLI